MSDMADKMRRESAGPQAPHPHDFEHREWLRPRLTLERRPENLC